MHGQLVQLQIELVSEVSVMKDKLISDRQVIKAILDNKELFRFAEDIQRFAVVIEDLPSMDRPQGEWIKDGHHMRCNQCGVCFCNKDREGDEFPQDFCPSCGARMKGIDDEKECHKPESQSYRAYCEEWKDEVYCEGCKFWY